MGKDGSYVQFYVRLLTDPDYLCLSGDARHVLFVLMGLSNVAGLNRVFLEQMTEASGRCAADVEGALVELETARGADGQPHPWIKRDGTLIWIRNYLRYRPFVKLSSPSILKAVETILADHRRSPLAAEFRKHYRMELL